MVCSDHRRRRGSGFRAVGRRRGQVQGLPQLPRGRHEEDGTFLQGHRREAQGDKGAADAIAAKLKDGKGHPKVAASDADIKAAVGYVLSQ
jgi:hypothetical protein